MKVENKVARVLSYITHLDMKYFMVLAVLLHMFSVGVLTLSFTAALAVHALRYFSRKHTHPSLFCVIPECLRITNDCCPFLIRVLTSLGSCPGLSGLNKESQKTDNLPVLATCWSGASAMLSSIFNSPIAHGGC